MCSPNIGSSGRLSRFAPATNTLLFSHTHSYHLRTHHQKWCAKPSWISSSIIFYSSHSQHTYRCGLCCLRDSTVRLSFHPLAMILFWPLSSEPINLPWLVGYLRISNIGSVYVRDNLLLGTPSLTPQVLIFTWILVYVPNSHLGACTNAFIKSITSSKPALV